jgi:predicted histone-like DNA-binding protein
MTVFYRLRQDNQERSKHKGQWFAHAVNLSTIETDELARIIERNCSVKRSDVLAVLAELSDTVARLLADSHRVRLAGIGSLMVGLNGLPCSDPTQYNNSYITGLHLCFKPEKELRLTDAEIAPLPP